jgi:hypothetical protein
MYVPPILINLLLEIKCYNLEYTIQLHQKAPVTSVTRSLARPKLTSLSPQPWRRLGDVLEAVHDWAVE